MSDDFDERVISHGTSPRNYGPMTSWDGRAEITGPCGDTMVFWVEITGKLVTNVQFTTDGCVSSRAAGSITTTLARKRSLTSCLSLGQQEVLDALGGLPDESAHCALLATNTLKAACNDYLERAKSSPYMPEDLVEACRDCTTESCPALVRRENEDDAAWLSRQALLSTTCTIKHTIFVLSGKGGVGKSTVAVNLAHSLSQRGFRVGLLDADIHGPSVPHMLSGGEQVEQTTDGTLAPVSINGIKVMSMTYLMDSGDTPAIWRGPMKATVIGQFITEVSWGTLDYLIVDSPPGTGDEAQSLAQLIPDAMGAIIVTTPQTVALQSVSKCITFCRTVGVPIIGLVENWSSFTCPKCGVESPFLGRDGGKKLADAMDVAFLGTLPFDHEMAVACDSGVPFLNSHSHTVLGQRYDHLVESILNPKHTETPTP